MSTNMIIVAKILITIVVIVALVTIVMLNHENVLRLHGLCTIPSGAAKAKAYYIWGLGSRVYGFRFWGCSRRPARPWICEPDLQSIVQVKRNKKIRIW